MDEAKTPIEFIWIHRGTVLTVPSGVLVCKSSDGFSVLVDEWLNDGTDHVKPEERRYTMYELQVMTEQAEGKAVFYVWD